MDVKVANIILEGRFGGPQHRILQIASRLRRGGIETVVIIPTKNSDTFFSKLSEENIQVLRLRLHRLTRKPSQLLGNVVYAVPELIALYKTLKREHVEIVHCNGAWQVKGIVAGKLAGAKVILHLNDTLRWTKVLFTLFGPLCDGFIVTGQRVRDLYFSGVNRKLQRKKVSEIQAPVDVSRFDPDRVTPDSRLAGVKGIKITTIGNINPLKGMEYFVEMAAILTKHYSDLTFYIVGPQLETQKGYSRQLLNMVKHFKLSNFVFYGEADDVAAVLKASDIFVCPSISESGPMSVWEAMAMRKAIVSTDVGDVSRYIQTGKSGFVVPCRDASGLAEKVRIFIEDEELRNVFGKVARETAVNELNTQLCTEKHLKFYLDLLN